MTARTGLLLVIFVTLLSTSNALCVLGLLDINLCLFPPCELSSLLGSCQPGDAVSISLHSGENYDLVVTEETILSSLSLVTSGTASILLSVNEALLSITGDLLILGATVSIAAGASVQVTGNVEVGYGSILSVAGILNVQGTTLLNGNLDMSGTLATGNDQTAWVYSTVNISGIPSAPASITGNGGIGGSLTVSGNASTGVQGSDSSIFISEGVQINAGSTFRVAGNLTVQSGVQSFGRLHLDGTLENNKHEYSWLITPFVMMTGSDAEPAKLTGNGGIEGDVTLGSSSGIAAGNSPGVVTVAGNLLMYPTSFMEIEVANWNDFDQYVVTRILYRNGILYVNFENGYLPNTNDRFSFCSHQNATGTFNTVYANQNEVLAAYSNKSTIFIYDDPQSPAYCTCTLVAV